MDHWAGPPGRRWTWALTDNTSAAMSNPRTCRHCEVASEFANSDHGLRCARGTRPACGARCAALSAVPHTYGAMFLRGADRDAQGLEMRALVWPCAISSSTADSSGVSRSRGL